jgi:hypothetical protein
MNVRWWHSQRILVASLVTAMLAVGVLTSLVIRQQQGQADGQIYLETGGTVNAKRGVPVIGRPTMVGGSVEGSAAPVQAAAGTEVRADDKRGSQARCACGSPRPAAVILRKVQRIHRATPETSFRPQRIAVHHWDPPAQPPASGPPYQPTLPAAGPSPDEMGKLGPSGAVRPEKIGPPDEAKRPEKFRPSVAPTPHKGI